LIVDGLFCLVVGGLLVLASGWLPDELPVAETWMIAAAGIVTAVWGALLAVASRRLPTRGLLGSVAIVNALAVIAVLVWLVAEGSEMSGIGLAVVGVLGISVLRFAIYQSAVLRQ
jgi:hypothetical protein